MAPDGVFMPYVCIYVVCEENRTYRDAMIATLLNSTNMNSLCKTEYNANNATMSTVKEIVFLIFPLLFVHTFNLFVPFLVFTIGSR